MLNLMHLEAGRKLRLRNGSTAEIVENPGDGIWLQMRFLTTAPDGIAVGDEELVHCEEIAGLVDEG